MSPRLDDATWEQVVRYAPLISFDLLVRHQGRVLLGLRTNQPAQDTWFVPGGVIRKGETLEQAFARVTEAELGEPVKLADSQLHGVYEHFYDSNFRGDDSFGTHYVVLARRLAVKHLLAPPVAQHSDYCWLSEDELLAHPRVHANVKRYFLQVGAD